MKKSLLVIVALIIAVVLPMSIAAQEKDVEVKVEVIECDHGSGKSAQAKCDLDPEVALNIQKLNLELKIKNLELEKKVSEIHKEIYGAYLEEKPDVKKIKKLTKEMLAVKGDLMENQHDHFLAVRKLVPIDHFKMFMAHHGHGAKMGSGMHGKMGHGRSDCCSHGKMDGCRSIKSGKGCGTRSSTASGCSHHKGAGKCVGKGEPCEERVIKVIKKIKE